MTNSSLKSTLCALVIPAALAASGRPVAHGQGNVLIVQAAPAAAPAPADPRRAVDPANAIRAQIIIRGAPAARAAPAAAPAAAPIAAEEAAEKADGDNNPQLVALRQQFEPMLKVELSFANRVCQWTPAERIAAIAVGQTWLREFAREYAKNGGRGNGGFMIMAGNQAIRRPAPEARPEQKLSEALARAMTDEQRAAYKAERAKRDAFRARASVDNIVAQMDQRLELSAEQRRQVRAALRKTWSEDWAPPLELFVQMTEYAPAFPDEPVIKFLTPEQRGLWQNVQRISARGVIFGGRMFGNELPPIDDFDLNEGK